MGSVTLFEAFPEFFQAPTSVSLQEEDSEQVLEDEKQVENEKKIEDVTKPTKRKPDVPLQSLNSKPENVKLKKAKIENSLPKLAPPLVPLEVVKQPKLIMPPPLLKPPLKTPHQIIELEVQKRLHMAKVASRCSWDGIKCLKDDQCSFVASVLQLRPRSKMKRVEVIQKMEVRPRFPLLPADPGFNQPLPLKPKQGQSMFAILPDEVVSPKSSSSLQNIRNPQAVQDFPTLTLKLEAGTLQLQPSQDQPGKVQPNQNQDGQAQLGQGLPKLSFKLEGASEEDRSVFTSPAARILHLPEEVVVKSTEETSMSNTNGEGVVEMKQVAGECDQAKVFHLPDLVGEEDNKAKVLHLPDLVGEEDNKAKVLHLPEDSANTDSLLATISTNSTEDSLLATIFGISSKPTVASPFFASSQPKASSSGRSTTPSSISTTSPSNERAVTSQSISPSTSALILTSSTPAELSFASQVRGLKASQGVPGAGNSNLATDSFSSKRSSSSEGNQVSSTTRPPGIGGPSSSGRCGNCPAISNYPGCTAAGTAGPKSTPTRRLASADCGTCRSCMDKKSNGGKGILKKACVGKQCHRLFAKPAPPPLQNGPRTATLAPAKDLVNNSVTSKEDLLPLLPLLESPTTSNNFPERETSAPPMQKHLSVALPYPCSTCDFTFSSNNELAKHVRNKHVDYKCSKCVGSFKGYYRMANHMKREHKGEPTLACPCGRTFSVPKGLAKHQSTCALGPGR